jgi:protein-S-isoprenylcysteine O-methyltransferase Ste14
VSGKSLPNFYFVYRYIQISTLAVSIASIFGNWPILLRLHNRTDIMVVGLCGALATFGLFIWAKSALGDNYSPCFDSYLPQAFKRTGPYKFVRHPIYSSNIVLLVLLWASNGSLWILANVTILAAYYSKSARQEEEELAGRFPAYVEYLKQTGRFVPKLRGPSVPRSRHP